VTHFLNYKHPTEDHTSQNEEHVTNQLSKLQLNPTVKKNTHSLNTKNNVKTSHFMLKVPIQHTKYPKHAQQ